MTPAPSSPAVPWWRRAWDNRRSIAGAIAAVLVFISPFLPAQYQLPARVAQQVARHIADDSSSSSPAAPATGSSSGPCHDDQVQSLPHFCRCHCVDGVCAWRDYFDADAGCPED